MTDVALLGAKLAGLSVMLAGGIVAQVAAEQPVVTWIGLGGQLGAVGGLVYVVRAMLTGDLVAQKTDTLIRMQADHLAAIEALTKNYERLAETVNRNEEHLLDLLEHPKPRPPR